MYDMNDAELPRGSDLIPDGSFVKVTMAIRKGGLDGQGESDRGLLKATKSPGSDVKMLDCEFTVIAGQHIRRKFWQTFTVIGGKVDEQGVSIGWKISKTVFRAMMESAQGLDPADMSEAAKQKRMLRGLADLHGIAFVAKIRIEPSTNPAYGDSNRLERVVLPNEAEWKKVMAGEAVAAAPSHRAARPSTPKASPQPAWKEPATAAAPAPSQTAKPAWDSASAPQQNTSPTPSKPAGPAWLNA
jgi:hypothetical protein